MTEAKPYDFLWHKHKAIWARASLRDGRYQLEGPPRKNKEGKLVSTLLVDIEADKADMLVRLSPCCNFLTNNPELFPGMRGFTPTDTDETTEDS